MGIGAILQHHWVPIVGIIAGSGAALVGLGQSATPAPAPIRAEARGSESSPPGPADPKKAEDPAHAEPALAGRVLEQIEVGKYSILRLRQGGSTEVWAAVPSTPSRVGDEVTVQNAERMENFTSPTLNRTFETIYFGVLGSPAQHADSKPHSNPHGDPKAQVAEVPQGKLERAPGPLGHTIAELHQVGGQRAGQRARLRAIVVKSTQGVLGKTFLHVRDGTGDAATGSNDLAVTTTAEPPVGSQVLLEGTVEVDRDFGSGYRYPVLLADATVVQE